MNWIISEKDDLFWLIGSAVFSYLLLVLHYLLVDVLSLSTVVSFSIIYFVFSVFFDATHAFATYGRTYLDPEFYSRNKVLLKFSLLVFVIGPCLILFGSQVGGEVQSQALYVVLEKVFVAFAYYHLIRQHWGILALYRKKGSESSPISYYFDALLLTVGALYPFVYLNLFNPKQTTLGNVGNLPQVVWESTLNISLNFMIVTIVLFGLSLCLKRLSTVKLVLRNMSVISAGVFLVLYLFVDGSLKTAMEGMLLILQISFAGTILFYVIYSAKTKRNLSKLVFLATVLLVHNTIPYTTYNFVLIFMALTIFHNVQYHRIVWFHNQNKYSQPDSLIKNGFAARMAQNLILYVIVALLYNVVTTLPRYFSINYLESTVLLYVVATFFMGLAFHHYVLDAYIWKTNRDQKLRTNMGVK